MMKSNIVFKSVFAVILTLMASLTVHAAQGDGNGSTPAATAASEPAAFEVPVYGSVPVMENVCPEKHFLGGAVTEKWNTFLASYTNTYDVSVGLSDVNVEIRKPSIYNAVKRANKYVKKQVKDQLMSHDDAVTTMCHILDCANVMVLDADTKRFEQTASQARSGEQVVKLFSTVKLVFE